MFTGLIQTIGIAQFVGDSEISIVYSAERAGLLFQDLEIGDSVAVDGICLTVAKIFPSGFIAAASPETVCRTTLAQFSGSVCVNLEPSLRVGSKLGGHFVTGHVDGVGYLEAATQTEDFWDMSFIIEDPRISRYIVSKGSVAINGISLTVADCSATGDWFKVAVIPLTYAETNLHHLQPGSWVNLEGDVLGKYVEKFLRLGVSPAIASDSNLPVQALEALTPAFLTEHGYL